MPEYLHPGVYVEETSFRAKPIEGVSTSTAGLVGRTRKGPEGRPTLVTSFGQFEREFGSPIAVPVAPGDFLGHAVRAFFENGGRRAYIVRALAHDAEDAESVAGAGGVGLGAVLRLPPTATVIGPTTTLPLDSLRNVQVGSVLRIFARSTATTPATLRYSVTVSGYDPTRNTVDITTTPLPTGAVLQPASTFVLVDGVAPHGAHVDGPVARARSRGEAGKDIAIEFRPRDLSPTRLATRRYQRNQPVIATFGGTGPTAGSTMTLGAGESRHLRVNDVIAFSGSTTNRTVTAIAAGTMQVGTAPSGPGAKNFTSGTVRLVSRGAAAPAPGPVIAELGGSITFDLSGITAGTSFAAPHAVVATAQIGDVLEVSDGVDTASLDVTAVAIGATANNVTFSPALSGTENFATATVRLVDTAPGTSDTTRIVVGNTSGLVLPFRAPVNEGISITSGNVYEGSLVRLVDTATNQIYVTRASAPNTFPNAVTNANWTSFETRTVVAAGTTTFSVASTSGFYVGAIVEIDNAGTKTAAIVSGVDSANRTITVNASPGLVEVPVDPAQRRVYVRTLEVDVLVYERQVSGLAGSPLVLKESFTNLSWNHDPVAASYSRYYIDRINDPETGSKLIRFDVPAAPPGPTPSNQPTSDEGFPLYLENGSDGSTLEGVDLIGKDDGPGQRRGIHALAERKDIALVAVPGVTDENVQQALIAHCELLKYRFAVLDGRPATPVVTDILAHRNNYDSKYAAYYAPWLKTIELSTGRSLMVPPSGHVLGICARVDSERGVHKAPANETIRGITDVELPFTDGEQDVLNPAGVNLTREFEGRGIRLWGARTISSDAEWKYVNVRRLFIYLEHSIDNGTQWVVFEPNNEALWARVKATIESFLYGVWKTGALMGTKPEDAYFVRCDRSTMTQDDIDNGRLVCTVGVAPTYPAEFVIFRIGQFTASSNVA